MELGCPISRLFFARVETAAFNRPFFWAMDKQPQDSWNPISREKRAKYGAPKLCSEDKSQNRARPSSLGATGVTRNAVAPAGPVRETWSRRSGPHDRATFAQPAERSTAGCQLAVARGRRCNVRKAVLTKALVLIDSPPLLTCTLRPNPRRESLPRLFPEIGVASAGTSGSRRGGHSGIIEKDLSLFPPAAHDDIEDRSIAGGKQAPRLRTAVCASVSRSVAGFHCVQPGRMDAGYGRHLADDRAHVRPPC